MSEQGDRSFFIGIYWSRMTSATFQYAGGHILAPFGTPRFIVLLESTTGDCEVLGHYPTAEQALLHGDAFGRLFEIPVEDRIG